MSQNHYNISASFNNEKPYGVAEQELGFREVDGTNDQDEEEEEDLPSKYYQDY